RSIILIRGQTVTESAKLRSEVSGSLEAINDASVDGYGALLKLETLGNRTVGTLSLAPFAADAAAREALRDDLRAVEAETTALLQRLSTRADISETAELAGQLIGFGTGEASVFELGAGERAALLQADDLLVQTNDLTRRMSDIAALIVAEARASTDASTAEVLSALGSSRLSLALVISVSFVLIGGAIAYVNRSLGSRLSAFSNAALSLAEGDLSVTLPKPTGTDEVTRLMRALTVFRDTALEMEQSNLREIAQTRQRLIDAIESISDGFAFFDSDDRLVLCNTRYRDFLNDPEGRFVLPGKSAAEIAEIAPRGSGLGLEALPIRAAGAGGQQPGTASQANLR
ncbi:MAG TPA: HAMP domain-containing protein, partial [Sphingomonadaceae bacterium]|nr:HAMP domain-containing protein [Sphingomonadaceae bacterium]